MPYVLTTDPSDTVTCQHAAALTKVPAVKLQVQNKPVVTDLPAVTAPPGCPMVPTPASPNNVPCTTMKVSSGQATKLKVGGVSVLLATVAGSAVSVPPASPGGALIAVVGPKKLSAI
jgi:hypothetical protein